MEVTLVMVMSVDGKITFGNDPDVSSWSSGEDQEHFGKLIDEAKVVVMGRKTYEVVKHLMEHKKGRVRIVMTKSPEKYQSMKWVKFTDQIPKEKEMLVVGGSEIATLFLQRKLVSRLVLTIEPVVFGAGENLLSDLVDNVQLRLISSKKLNQRGTLLLEYEVRYES